MVETQSPYHRTAPMKNNPIHGVAGTTDRERKRRNHLMKAAYTGWTWITSREARGGQKAACASPFAECKFLGYDTVEKLRLYPGLFPRPPGACRNDQGVRREELVNLYGHFTFDVEEAIRVAKEQIDFCAAVGVKWYKLPERQALATTAPSERPTKPRTARQDVLCGQHPGGLRQRAGASTLCFHPHYGTCVFWQSDIDYFAEHTDPQYVSFCFDTDPHHPGGLWTRRPSSASTGSASPTCT